MKIIKLLAIMSLVVSLSGCFANMALKKGQESIDLSEKSIALVSVKVSNQNKPEYQPNLTFARFVKDSPTPENITIALGRDYYQTDTYKTEPNKFNEYLLSFSLTPGSYNFTHLFGNTPLVYEAYCILPLNTNFTINPNSVTYLGNIEAVIRERKNEDEKRASMGMSLAGIFSNKVAGFYEGTFDVTINDKFDEDIKVFMSEYPALQKYKIEKSILPPWIRPKEITKTN